MSLFEGVNDPDEDPEPCEPLIDHYFVDESGSPALFAGKGRRKRCLLDDPKHPKFFLIGKLRVDDPDGLAADFADLRDDLMTNPELVGIPSLHPDGRKTAKLFHAKDDAPEVREEVFRLLTGYGNAVRFYAAVRDMRVVRDGVLGRNRDEPGWRYRENDLYDDCVSDLFKPLRRHADEYHVCFARRGRKNRTAALDAALRKAAAELKRSVGIDAPKVQLSVRSSAEVAGLQAADYYLWAVQRYYCRGEAEGYLRIRAQSYLHDLDVVTPEGRGRIFRPDGASLATRRL